MRESGKYWLKGGGGESRGPCRGVGAATWLGRYVYYDAHASWTGYVRPAATSYVYLDVALTTPDFGVGLPSTRVVIELFSAELPLTTNNFLHLCIGDKVSCHAYFPLTGIVLVFGRVFVKRLGQGVRWAPLLSQCRCHGFVSRVHPAHSMLAVSCVVPSLVQECTRSPGRPLCYRNSSVHRVFSGAVYLGDAISSNGVYPSLSR